jgi:hypothetical protein
MFRFAPHSTTLLLHRLARFAGIACFAAAAGSAAADDCADPKSLSLKGSEFQLFIENDMLAHSDRYYTNGIKICIGVPGDTLSELFCNSAKRVLAPFSDEVERIHFGWFIGQNLYTPRKITIADPQPNDRPWASWSYIGGVAQRVNKAGNMLDTVEIDLGFVGPISLGDQIQTGWHRLIGASKPRGWGNQIPSEPAFLVSYVHKHKFKSEYVELIPHGGITLGNVFTLARAGALARFGLNMTGFGPDTIEPGGAMLQNTRDAADPGNRQRFELYAFAGVDGRLVARNIFLDGTLFRDSPSVTKRDFVHDVSVGASVRYRAVRVSLTRIKRSEEFFTAAGGGGSQTFDSLNVGIEF